MFWENFSNLCNKNGITPNVVTKKLGLSSGTASFWKQGKVPHHSTLIKIADYFNVSVDYLLGNETQPQVIEPNAVFLDDKRVYMIPMYESVSAGFGASAINEVVGYEPCHIPNPADAAESLCIRVSGDSMFPKIEDGDIIQVHKQTSVDSGSIAVVLLDNEEGLVKKVLYGDDWIELHSINPMYPIQRFDGKDVLRIKVVGLVKAIIKRL
jgi:phage repressor protein C with HTH and peptisase S24 domain